MARTKEERARNKLGRTGFSACSNRSSDTNKLSKAAENFEKNLPSPSTSELIQYYGGDKYKTAYELTRQELGTTGTIEEYQRMYKTTLHDINRYLRKTRSPSEAMKQRFRNLYQPESKKSLKVAIRGCVRVSDEYYYKDSTWNKPIEVPAQDVVSFIKLAQENNVAGYMILNGLYMKSGNSDNTFDWLDNVQINMYY